MENLKRLREKAQLTQQALADLLGSISQQTIQRYENGLSAPDIQTLIRLADIFDTSIDFLVGHTAVQCKVEDYVSGLNENEQELICRYRSLPLAAQSTLYDVSAVLQKNIK